MRMEKKTPIEEEEEEEELQASSGENLASNE